jgi:hypothetical protein
MIKQRINVFYSNELMSKVQNVNLEEENGIGNDSEGPMSGYIQFIN